MEIAVAKTERDPPPLAQRTPGTVVDPVLEAYVEEDRSQEELLAEFDPAVVERAVALVDRAEYKRRQAPPGVKLRPKAFGRDRRLPITNRYLPGAGGETGS